MILVQLSGLRWPRPAVTQTEVKAAMEGIRSRKIYLRREVRVGENLSSDFLRFHRKCVPTKCQGDVTKCPRGKRGRGRGGDLALGTGTDQDQDQVYLDTLAYHQHYKKLVFSRGVNEV